METLTLNPSKELLKAISKISYYSVEQFEKDAIGYIAAIESGRMCCIINSVSRSGMSRTLAFKSCEEGNNGKFWYRQYWCLFKALGYKPSKSNKDYFLINGGGMDMVFNTNYCIVGDLVSLGLLTKEEGETLRQQTPTIL